MWQLLQIQERSGNEGQVDQNDQILQITISSEL